MILYGLLAGMFVVIFRVWSVYPDGVVFSILIMNNLNPLLDKIRPKVPVRRPEEAAA
jgi:electron transport complex protein RnfD